MRLMKLTYGGEAFFVNPLHLATVQANGDSSVVVMPSGSQTPLVPCDEPPAEVAEEWERAYHHTPPTSPVREFLIRTADTELSVADELTTKTPLEQADEVIQKLESRLAERDEHLVVARAEVVKLDRKKAEMERERDNWKSAAKTATAGAEQFAAERDALRAVLEPFKESLHAGWCLPAKRGGVFPGHHESGHKPVCGRCLVDRAALAGHPAAGSSDTERLDFCLEYYWVVPSGARASDIPADRVELDAAIAATQKVAERKVRQDRKRHPAANQKSRVSGQRKE